MMAVAVVGTLLSFLIACWLIRLGIEELLTRIFGKPPK
jgi:high-affinity Fe2+/Pb2+ permease